MGSLFDGQRTDPMGSLFDGQRTNPTGSPFDGQRTNPMESPFDGQRMDPMESPFDGGKRGGSRERDFDGQRAGPRMRASSAWSGQASGERSGGVQSQRPLFLFLRRNLQKRKKHRPRPGKKALAVQHPQEAGLPFRPGDLFSRFPQPLFFPPVIFRQNGCGEAPPALPFSGYWFYAVLLPLPFPLIV